MLQITATKQLVQEISLPAQFLELWVLVYMVPMNQY